MKLPHAVLSPHHGRRPRLPAGTLRTWLIVLASAVPAFFAGTLVSLMANLEGCSNNGAALQEQQHQPCPDVAAAKDTTTIESGASSGQTTWEDIFPPDVVGNYAAGMARTSLQDFFHNFDLGVPITHPDKGHEDALILYSTKYSLPEALLHTERDSPIVPQLSVHHATESCDQMHMILTDTSGRRKQCLAIIPQYESFHIQRWVREKSDDEESQPGQLQLVSRGHLDSGREEFRPPKASETQEFFDMLHMYLESLPALQEELGPLLKEAGGADKTVIVMVCNFGQSELLINFACAARSRGLSLDKVVVFTTDQETTDLAKGMGLKTYFDHRNFGDIPAEAAGRYGDYKFTAMMMAKVICVQLVSLMGYNLLFQDVDIVWFKNPLDYFQDKSSPARAWDVFFQDDGAHSLRFAPYSANSGFYYVKHNDKTRNFLTALLMAGDIVISTKSHQQALIAVLNEHVTLYGLKAKVLGRDEPEFPGGYQFHHRSGVYMRALLAGEVHPYIFHMSWTENKNNKLLFFRQLGEWYVQDVCVAKAQAEITLNEDNLVATCCAAEPLVSCHYRDKPSKIPCRESPPIDKGRRSFW